MCVTRVTARHVPRGYLVLAANSQILSATEGTVVSAAYVTITILTSAFTGIAAVTYLIGHDYPKAQLDMKHLPRSWVPMLGTLLAAGSLGLLAGFAVPLRRPSSTAGVVVAAGVAAANRAAASDS